MKKSKSKSKAVIRATSKKNSKTAKPVDLVEVRKDMTNIIGSEATKLAQAVVEEARKGQLAPVKYLFEVAGLYPVSAEAGSAKPEENSLARTLLDRLGLPEEALKSFEGDLPAESMLRAGKNSVSHEPGKRDSVGAERKTAEAEVVNEDAIPVPTGAGPVE
jgi:hypothetical protein